VTDESVESPRPSRTPVGTGHRMRCCMYACMHACLEAWHAEGRLVLWAGGGVEGEGEREERERARA
jgi:hypothetical protein